MNWLPVSWWVDLPSLDHPETLCPRVWQQKHHLATLCWQTVWVATLLQEDTPTSKYPQMSLHGQVYRREHGCTLQR